MRFPCVVAPKCSNRFQRHRTDRETNRETFLAEVNGPPSLSPNKPNQKCQAAVDVAISPVLQAPGTPVERICERLHFIHLAPFSSPTLNVTAVPQESIDYIDPEEARRTYLCGSGQLSLRVISRKATGDADWWAIGTLWASCIITSSSLAKRTAALNEFISLTLWSGD